MVAPQYSWDKFKTNQPIPQKEEAPDIQKPIQDSNEQPKNYSWGNFKDTSTYQGEPDPTENESTLGYLARNLFSNTARIAESANPVARTGNAIDFLKNVASKVPASTGLLGKALHSFVGQETWDRMIFGNENAQTQGLNVPTSNDFRKVTEALTGDYTKPKTKNEKRFQEFTSDVGSTLRRVPTNTRNVLVNNLGIPAAANAAKQVVEGLGFGEDKATWSKLAAWTTLSLLSNVNAPAYAANLMNQGRQGFNQNTIANVPRYQNGVDTVSKNMLQGDPRSALAQQQIAGIRNDIASGQTTMPDLMRRYDAINAAKRDRGLFELNKVDRRAAVHNINQVRDAVRREIEHIGQSNPQALQAWQDGVQAFSVIHQSTAMTNWIQNIAKGPYAKVLTSPVAGVLGLSGYGTLKAPIVGLSATAAVPTAYKTFQVGYRIWNDPSLSRYYWDALNAARQENQAAFIKSFNALDKEYIKKFGDL